MVLGSSFNVVNGLGFKCTRWKTAVVERNCISNKEITASEPKPMIVPPYLGEWVLEKSQKQELFDPLMALKIRI